MNAVKKIDDTDFEFYTVKMPFILQRKKRSAYLLKELEKNHPCFSDRCWWKSRISYSGKGFTASIAVIDKVKFARYKEEFPGKILKFEDKGKKILFVDKGSVVTALTAIFFCFVIMLFFILGKNNAGLKTDPLLNENAAAEKQSDVLQSDETALETCRNLFRSISLCCGKIVSLTADSDGISLNLYKCFPEEIDCGKLICSELVFKENVPYFSMQGNFNDSGNDACYEKLSEEEVSVLLNECRVKIRNFLLKKNVSVISEDSDANCIEFESESIVPLLNEINEIIVQEKISLEEMSICREENLFSIRMKFCGWKNYVNQLLPVITENAEVFTDKPEVKKEISDGIRKERIVRESNWEKIGSITDSSSQYVFYRDSDGKIRSVKK